LKRLADFLRSVIPADPTQLLFLAGIVCFVIAPRLRWWPVGLRVAPYRLADPFGRVIESLGILALCPIIFASLAGYFFCFWSGKYPTRRVLLSVCVPALAGLCLTVARFLYLTKPYSSVLESASHASDRQDWAWTSLPGFHIWLVGMLLVAAYTSRLALGIATLPLALPKNSVVGSNNQDSWRGLKVVIWLLIGPLFIVLGTLTWEVMAISVRFSAGFSTFLGSPWFTEGLFLAESFSLGFLLWIVGKETRQAVRSLIRVPGYLHIAAALAIPIGISLLLSIGQYLVARTEWAAHDFGRFDPPQFMFYFRLPSPWLLLAFFPSFFEELIFRGLLQPKFLQRYGLYRGIFLVGVAWAAFHFFSDFAFSGFTDQDVPLRLGFRVFMCIVLSFVLGWLTLRSLSIFPAAIAHSLYNVLASGLGPPFPGRPTIRIAMWAVMAIALFHWWPIDSVSESAPDSNLQTPEASATADPSVLA
jgi:membrane protease YdiL (CAAX protease family)